MKIKIKKFEHSCLLVEIDNKKFLYDPGDYSRNTLLENKNNLEGLDYLLVTHEHFDHCNSSLIEEIASFNKNLKIIAPKSVMKKIALGSYNTQSTGDEIVSIENAPHEYLLDMKVPENFSITVMDALTHVGDSLQFKKTADVLALPIQAPWGSMTEAALYALSAKPRYIIPIHDWHWKDEVRKSMYERLENFFKNHNIKFLNIYGKESVEIDLR